MQDDKRGMPNTIGLDIGSSAVRAVQVATGGRGPARLERVGEVVLPHGAIRDGEIVDPPAVTEALRTLWDRYKFSSRKVALGLANQQVVVRQVDLPYLPEADLRASLAFQAQEFIPIPVEQAILDFHVLENYETEDGARFSRILLVAAQRTMVETITDCVRAAKLIPVLVDLDAFSMLRSLAHTELLAQHQGEMLLDIGSAVTNIVVHDNGVPKFVRILLMGGDGITDTLTSALGMTHEQAEHVKATTGVAVGAAGPDHDEAARLVTERANRFVEEIRGSLDYYAAQLESIQVNRVVLSGGAAQLPNLTERLSSVLGLPVDRGHPMQELKIGKLDLDHEQLVDAEPYLAVAIGLALGAAEG